MQHAQQSITRRQQPSNSQGTYVIVKVVAKMSAAMGAHNFGATRGANVAGFGGGILDGDELMCVCYFGQWFINGCCLGWLVGLLVSPTLHMHTHNTPQQAFHGKQASQCQRRTMDMHTV